MADGCVVAKANGGGRCELRERDEEREREGSVRDMFCVCTQVKAR